MTLEEAKSILEQEKRLCLLYGGNQFIGNIEAIDTVLKALQEYEKQLDLDYVRENYIPKKKVREKVEEIIRANPENQDWDGTDYTATPEEDFAIEKLEELL